MKNLLLIIILTPLFCIAQNINYSKGYDGKTIAKDQYGNIIATGEKDYSGAYVWKDQYGNIIKKETVDYLGRNVSKDQYGNTISTGQNNYLGEYEEKDQYGNLIAKYKSNYIGEVVKTDQYGNIIGKYKYNYDGNLIYQSQESATYTAPSNNSGAYSNPRVITTEPSNAYSYSLGPEANAAIGRGLARHLTGFGVYGGYNSGFNFGLDLWIKKKAGVGVHFGLKNIPDSDGYGENIRTEYAVNYGFIMSKKKNIILKTTFGFTDLDVDYDAYPDFPEKTYDEWLEGYDIWADKAYSRFFYKVGLQLAMSKKNNGSGFSPEIYYSNYGIGISIGYIFNRKNNLYPD